MKLRSFLPLASFCIVLSSGAASAWDVTDTGQPFTEAEFTVTEGTWMSVDVSPDGRMLVFDLLGDIYSMPASGGEARLLHGGPAVDRLPSFSPDGKRLLYISDKGGSDNIWISDSDGSDARQISEETVNVVAAPVWGPMGDYVVAARMFATADRLHASELRLFHVAGGAGRLLVATPGEGENVHEAELSPDGRYLYYVEKVTPPTASVVFIDANHTNYEIKRRDLATGETRSLIGGFGSATTPQVSPDGKRIAFVRRVQDKTVLFVYDTETGRERPVYDALDRDGQADFLGQGAYYPQYDWFPDNRHVAIWGKGKLYKIDMDEGGAVEIPFRVTSRHQITDAPRFGQDLAPAKVEVRAIRQLAAAPDGQDVAFNALGRLWRKQLPGGQPQRLTDSSGFEFEPAYAPDGQRIAFVEWVDERGGALKIASRDGRNIRTLFSGPGVIRQPAFSPDGKRIVFKIDAGDKCMGGYRAKPGLYWIPAEGGEAHFISGQGDAPQFSPDGQRVYYTTATGADTLVESVNLEGFDRREHARAVGADRLELTISPDLKWIAFKELHQYYVMPYRETGAPVTVSATSNAVPVHRLTEIGGDGITWSADSRHLHWTLGPSLYRTSIADLGEPMEAYATVGLEVAADKPHGLLALTNARIITMQDDRVIDSGTIIVEGNRILAVGTADQVAVPENAKVLDLTGKTIMPGLVDMHGHLDQCYYSSAGLMPQKQASHYAALAFGVTTNYDPYSADLAAYSTAEMNQAGVMVGPRSIVVGKVIYGRAGKSDASFTPIRDYEDAERVMARKTALGGTIVKSYRQPMRSQRQQLIKAGRDAGIMVDVEGESHFHFNVGMVLDGHTNLQHNLPVASYYDDVVQLMAAGKTAHTPTLIALFGELMGENYIYQTTRVWEDPKIRAFVPATTSGYSPLGTPYSAPLYARGMTTIHVADELWDIGFRSVARSIKKLDDAGVVINAGSHGQVFGLAMHWEMWLLAQGGMSNHRVLRAATLNGAKTLGLDDQIGSLEPGKLADLIILDNNPLDNIRNSNSVRYSMVNGRLYDSLTMDEVGNYDRPRGQFYWEMQDYNGIDWNAAWAEQ